MLPFSFLLFAAASLVSARNNYAEIREPSSSNKHSWFGGRFKNLVVFGDSYTDESRLDYFTAHNNTPPPIGLLLPESLDASDGGRVWPRCMDCPFEPYYAKDLIKHMRKRCQPILRRKALQLCHCWRNMSVIPCTLPRICCESTYMNDED